MRRGRPAVSINTVAIKFLDDLGKIRKNIKDFQAIEKELREAFVLNAALLPKQWLVGSQYIGRITGTGVQTIALPEVQETQIMRAAKRNGRTFTAGET